MSRTFLLLALLCLPGFGATGPIQLTVDATDAPRRIFHARMLVPTVAGPLRLAYPKWIPGEHAPTGPVADLAGLRITAAGKRLDWRRDPVDMFVIVVDVPTGVSAVEVVFDLLSPPDSPGFSSGASATTEMAVLSWNQVLLYPQGHTADAVEFQAKIKVPAGWRYGTALPIARESGDTVEFKPAPLTTLVDSPVIAGRHFRTIELSAGAGPAHFLHLAADSPAAVNISPALIENYKRVVAETGTLFGARHYRSYHFLVSLSDHVAHFGLEHHESSDNRIPEFAMVDEDSRKLHAGLLPHEMAHSWNGKYRRPTGLATSDYQKPMEGELLWVYEGLTTYLGNILTPRSGLTSAEDYRADLAASAAELDHRAGRKWRPLVDTTVAAQILYGSRGDYRSLRRSVDFYPEGALIWLEADVIIRRESKGKRSLDDFCKRFFGGASGPPALKTYTFEDVVAELSAVQAYNWRGFFEQRVNQVTERAPLGGITGAGWNLVYREEAPTKLKARESEQKSVDLRYSLGVMLKDDGTILDVLPETPAEKAGLAPGGKILAVNGHQFSGQGLRSAIRTAKGGSDPIELIVKDGEIYKTHRALCHTGERYPALERDASKPDLLSEIVRRTGA